MENTKGLGTEFSQSYTVSRNYGQNNSQFVLIHNVNNVASIANNGSIFHRLFIPKFSGLNEVKYGNTENKIKVLLDFKAYPACNLETEGNVAHKVLLFTCLELDILND